MKRRTLYVLIIIGGIVSIFIILLLGGISYDILKRHFSAKKELNTAPTVYINYPDDGATVVADSLLSVNVTAAGSNPITQLEMWLDGNNAATQTPPAQLGASNRIIYHTFDMSMKEGVHLLYFQAIDSRGLVGQSNPISIIATPIPSSAITTTQTTGEIGAAPPPEMGATSEIPPTSGLPPTGGLPPSDGLPPTGGLPPSGGFPSTGARPPQTDFVIEREPLPVPPSNVRMLNEAILPTIDIGPLLALVVSNMPKAPSDFKAGFENCKVRLTWRDNADNESNFKVYMQRLGGPVQLIKTLESSPGNGLAWFDFDAPASGIYSFWVEAANALGGQPSPKIFVDVNDASCKQDVLATRLEIKALDMYIYQNYNKIYCYLIVEGMSQRRIPEDPLDYINVLNQWADITSDWGGEKHILVPIPADDFLSLEGECLGTNGGVPNSLGRFSEEIPLNDWNGSRLELGGEGFRIGYLIQLFGSTEAQGYYTFEDTGIPQPNFLYMKVKSSSNVYQNAWLGRTPELHWTWTGNPQGITGFNILLDGEFYRWAFPEYNWTTLLLPTSCGKTYALQVVAVSGAAQSIPSPIYYHVQPECEVYAEVVFETYTFESTKMGGCEDVEITLWIEVDDQYTWFGYVGGPMENINTWTKGCGTFNYKGLSPAFNENKPPGEDNIFIVPLSPEKTSIEIIAGFEEHNPFIWEAELNYICETKSNVYFLFTEWPEVDVNTNLPCPVSGTKEWPMSGNGYINVNIRGVASPSGK